MTDHTFMQNLSLKVKKYHKVSHIIEKLWSCRIQNFRLEAILIIYISMQNLWLKIKITIKSSVIHH